jgi:hypothetical protein
MNKQDYEKIITDTNNKINIIDNRSFYSFCYWRDTQTRKDLVALIEEIQIELLYLEDDEKRKASVKLQQRDPLKFKPVKISSATL